MALSSLIANDADVPEALRNIAITGLSSDSRSVQRGNLFAALAGGKTNGGQFVEAALAKGASAVVVESGTYKGAGPIIQVANPRLVLAHAAARFFGPQPETIVAVTGTNGKTSVAVFVRQIWAAMGFRAASLGTIGVVGPDSTIDLRHTTPDPIELHDIVAQLRSDHVKHLAVEASSHGLSQYRMDGLELTSGGFTNLTRDHLDYHASLEDYFDAKMRLFDMLLSSGSGAVINMDDPYSVRVAEIARKRGLVVWGVGRTGLEIKLENVVRSGLEQHIEVATRKGSYRLTLPLIGDFQVSNSLVAAGLVISAGGDEAQTFHALESLKGATGRLDHVGSTANGAHVFVDYAHTPDALQTALGALRPYVLGKLVVVFGCGGDRDPGKRPMMGEIASRFADIVYVTDDNPRSESPAEIRKQILAQASSAIEIGDRRDAIHQAMSSLEQGDFLLIAGKGHEEGQIVGDVVLPFKDHDVVIEYLKVSHG